MGIIKKAKTELDAINFGEETAEVMIDILKKYFNTWNSGRAVWAIALILQKLIVGKSLSTLTGKDDEWVDHGHGVFQNIRCCTVFKDPKFHDGILAYNIDHKGHERDAIKFPYVPKYHIEVSDPVIEI
jgi:hypothetical protein